MAIGCLASDPGARAPGKQTLGLGVDRGPGQLCRSISPGKACRELHQPGEAVFNVFVVFVKIIIVAHYHECIHSIGKVNTKHQLPTVVDVIELGASVENSLKNGRFLEERDVRNLQECVEAELRAGKYVFTANTGDERTFSDSPPC